MIRTFALAALSLSLTLPASAQFGRARGGGDILEKADADRDGYITREEYAVARAAQFDRMDRNKDGSVTRADFGRLARFKPDAVDRLMSVLSTADADQDGRITRAELEAAPMPVFERGDGDGDGRLSREEVEAIKAQREARR
ncbi:EF-hand domain-containing protein [Sphingomonas sp. MS122]|uniref:EF-hand domain-containing protein n=1 Tax=Sphingomonas sp. MS122 TaxID=3412683 RepID=UPI003C2B55FE